MVENKMESLDQTFELYEKIRDSIAGLGEILNINFNENNVYHQAGMDNLKALHENIIEMMKCNNSPQKIRMRLREIKYD